MVDLACKTLTRKVIRKDTIKLPMSVIEENGLGDKSTMEVCYGSNYSIVVLFPTGTKLGDKMIERINKLVSEPVGTDR